MIALHGRERLDEAGLADVTDLVILQDQKVRSLTLNPQELGLNKETSWFKKPRVQNLIIGQSTGEVFYTM